MNRWTVLFAVIVIGTLVAMGCSGGGGDPVTPTTDPAITAGSDHTGQVQTHLWGYYDIYIDIDNQTAEVVVNRTVMAAYNVVDFLNDNPAGVGISNLTTPVEPTYVDCILDVSLTHPLPMAEYNGYDVRGLFCGEGSATMAYNSDLDYQEDGSDQFMMNEDGFSRWFNAPEFTTPGVLGYTPGAIGTPGYNPGATMMPYKYYADGLGAEDDLWVFLTSTSDNGVFSAAQTNTRHYEIRFPLPTPGVQFGYAVVANWVDETTHPANAPEAVGCDLAVTDSVFWADALDNGGDLILDISLIDWDSSPNSMGVMDDYTIFIESDVLSVPYMCNPADMTPTGGASNLSTYHVEIPADAITHNSSTADGEIWIIAECADEDYTNDFGVINGADTDPLAAFFHFNFYIHFTSYNEPPVCDLVVVTAMPHIGDGVIEFDATGTTDPDGDPLTYEWDFDGDLIYGETPDDDYTGADDNPIHDYNSDYVGDVNLRVTDPAGEESLCTEAIDVTICVEVPYPCGAGTSQSYNTAYLLTSGYSTHYGDDGYSGYVPIGFTFSFGGQNFTQLRIMRNGGAGFTYFNSWYPYGCPASMSGRAIWLQQADLYSNYSYPIRYGNKTVNGVQCFIVDFQNIYYYPYYYNRRFTGQIILMNECNTTYDPWRVQWGYTYYYGRDSSYRAGGSSCCIDTYTTSYTAFQYGY